MSTQQVEYGLARISNQIRLYVAKLIYDGFSWAMMRDVSWQEPLFDSLAPQRNSRILDLGTGSSRTAIMLGCRFPETCFVGVDPNLRRVEKAMKDITRRHISNVRVLPVPLHDRLPLDGSSFDAAVCVLTFHDRLPDEKQHLANELRRVLRRGGTLHVADYDRPIHSGEQRILKFTERISGQAAAAPHLDGSWTNCFARAGLVGIRRQSSHSVGVGRICVVKARKP